MSTPRNTARLGVRPRELRLYSTRASSGRRLSGVIPASEEDDDFWTVPLNCLLPLGGRVGARAALNLSKLDRFRFLAPVLPPRNPVPAP